MKRSAFLFRFLTVAIWVLSMFHIAQAQITYPIQADIHLLPPHSLYLSDYYSGTHDKISITLYNRDQLQPEIGVRLRMSISAASGVRLRTREDVYYPPIMVENGLPLRLSSQDLAPYFHPKNLISEGFSIENRLPEGIVEFCFEVVETNTNRTVSSSSCARAYITYQKPPLLSLPLNAEGIPFADPFNLMFQWTPRHRGLAYVEYEFVLKEIWDDGIAPQAAFYYSPEIYSETVYNTSFNYGAMQPGLIPGKKYAWAVQARARDGIDVINVFENDGWSEIRWFTVSDNCPLAEYVEATAERSTLSLSWKQEYEHSSYVVSYRQIASSTDDQFHGEEWKQLPSQEPFANLYGLNKGGTYEYRVGCYCATDEPVYTPTFTVTLPIDKNRLAQCGLLPDVDLKNQNPLKSLSAGEEFMVSDYPIRVTQVVGDNGIYTGQGWTVIPWFNDAKLMVSFHAIGINSDRQMINGYVEAVYDPDEGQIANLDEIWEGGQGVGIKQTGITKIDLELDFSVPGVDAFSLDNDGNLVILDDQGTPHTITPQDLSGQGNVGNEYLVFPMVVKDKDGKLYQLDEVIETDQFGNEVKTVVATEIGNSGPPFPEGSFDPHQLNGDKAIVTFAKGDGKYAFDTWKEYYGKVVLIREKYEKLYENYYSPWKLLAAGHSDIVSATIAIKDNAIDPEKVIFATPEGTRFNYEYSNGNYTITLAAGPAGDIQEVYALYPNGTRNYYTLGKLGVATYNSQSHRVVLVRVNGVPVEKGQVQEMLDKTYGPVGVTWNITEADNFNYNEETQLMRDGTGVHQYNESMKALNAAYKAKIGAAYDPQANYLFLLKATGSEDINNRDITGFMPRGEQFGYIFTSEIWDRDEPQAIAHELAHGRWKLRHTFDEQYGGFEKGLTNNLLDYNKGTHLAKWQWDIMNDPAMLVNIFAGDEQSEHVVVKNTEELKGWEYNDVAYAFFAPSGKVILLPKEVKSVKFSTGDMAANANDNDGITVVPFGTLMAFNIDGDEFVAMWEPTNKQFTQYLCKKKNKAYSILSYLNASQLTTPVYQVIAGIPFFKEGGFLYHAYQLENTFTPVEEIKNPGYTGAGAFVPYDFLNSLILNETQHRVLSASPSFFDNPDAMAFVAYYAGLDSETETNDFPFFELYLYTHATLLDKYNLLGSCFATGLPGEFLRNVERYAYSVRYYRSYGYNMVSGEETQYIKFPENFELATQERVFKYLMSKWSDVDINYYKELHTLVSEFKSLSFPANLDEESIDQTLAFFKPYSDLDTDNFDCVFSEISKPNKINILTQLLATDDDDWGNKYEKITLKLLNNLSEEEVEPVYDILKKHPKYLFNAFKKMNNWLNKEFVFQFMHRTLVDWKRTHLSVVDEIESLSGIDFSEELSPKDFQEVIDHHEVILLEDERIFTGTNSDLILNTYWDSSDHLIDISQNQQFLNTYAETLLNSSFTGIGGIRLGRLVKGLTSKQVKSFENLNPLDPVIVFISKEDSTELKLHLPSGLYAVPAILIHWVRNTKLEEIRSFYTRIALDAIAVLLAPVTGGGSLLLITAELAIPAIDIAMSIINEEASVNNATFQTVFSTWEAFYATYGAILGGAGLIESGPILVRNAVNITVKTAKGGFRIVMNPAQAYKVARLKAQGLTKAKFDELVKSFDDFIALMIKNYGTQVDNYVAELRRFTNSVKINAEIRYVLTLDRLDGFLNPRNNFLLGKDGVRVFDHQLIDGLHQVSNIRFARNFTNVKRVKFVGIQDKVRYLDNGEELSKLFYVEDLDNPGSFFVVTEKELDHGISGITNFDDVVREYKAFEGITESIDDIVSRLSNNIRGKIAGKSNLQFNFSSSEIKELITHSKNLRFTESDIEAFLILHTRKHWVELDEIKKVITSLAEKSVNNNIQFKSGWDFMKAYREGQTRMLNGTFLNPREYLNESYIVNHLNNFNKKASYLLTGRQYKDFVKGVPKIGRKDGLFISTSQKIDDVLSKANGNISVIETELGIPPGSWNNQEGIYRVDVLNPEEFNLRIPYGSETGANEFWHPGGYTSGKSMEAVVDQIPAGRFKADKVVN